MPWFLPTANFFIGSVSPVIDDSSQIILFPRIMSPSTGKISPVSTCMISPTKSENIEIWTTFLTINIFNLRYFCLCPYFTVSDDTDSSLRNLRVEFSELLFFHVVINGCDTHDEKYCDKDRKTLDPTFCDTFIDAADHEGNECSSAKKNHYVFLETSNNLKKKQIVIKYDFLRNELRVPRKF